MYHIRLARLDDLSALPDIERAANALFADFGLAEQLANILTPIESLRAGVSTDRLWVAADEIDRPVGFALASVVGDNAHLDELDVHPAHGRRGLGAALVEAVCDWARASGYRAITMTTLRHIPWNAPWYQRLGFRVLEDNELSPALRDLLHEEIQRGLPADQRVAMRRELPVSRDTRNGRDKPMVTLSGVTM
jgi:GNAT superfamily N-acetyltransferase